MFIAIQLMCANLHEEAEISYYANYYFNHAYLYSLHLQNLVRWKTIMFL